MGRKNFNIRRTAIYHDYYARLKTIALSIFKWCNLPKTCDARFLEDTLFNYGIALFVEDDDMSFLNLKATPSGILNTYNLPVSFTGYGVNYSKEFDRDNCVLIRNNYLEKSTDSTLMIYAERLAEIELTSIINIKAQKTPILIRTEEKTRTSLTALYNMYEGDSPIIFGSKALQDKPLEVLRTDAPFLADKLREEKKAVWNEFLEFLGINTNPSDNKRERLIVDEVEANNEQIEIQGSTMLLTREEACEEINEKYGLNVSVEMRLDFINKLRCKNNFVDFEEKEGGEDEQLHD